MEVVIRLENDGAYERVYRRSDLKTPDAVALYEAVLRLAMEMVPDYYVTDQETRLVPKKG